MVEDAGDVYHFHLEELVLGFDAAAWPKLEPCISQP